MKKRVNFLSLVAVVLLLSACVSAPAPVAEAEPTVALAVTAAPEVETLVPTLAAPVETAIAELPSLSDEVEVVYAKNFSIEYKDGYKILTVRQPWSGAEETFVYYLIPEGIAEPEIPEGVQVFHTPVKAVISMSSTYLPTIEQLGKFDSLVGIDDATYIYNETVRSMAAEGKIVEIGGGASMTAVDLEKAVELKPDLILTSATGIPEMDCHPKLIEAGLPVALNADYLESSPLGRAEWGKFIAAFFDMEQEINTAFEAMVQEYDAIKAEATALAEKPTVFVNTDYQGTWYMPGNESYVAHLLRDAGADYLFSELEGVNSHPLKFETVYERAVDADFWLNVGLAADMEGLLAMDARYSDFKAVSEGKVYNHNARVNPNGGVDYYESGVAYPNLVLKDLVAIFHPELLESYSLYYYQAIQ